MPLQEFKPDTYYDAVMERLRGLDPIAAAKRAMQGAQSTAPTDPNLREGAPQEALPGNIDPNSPEFQARQRIAQALAAQGQRPAMPQQPASSPQIQF